MGFLANKRILLTGLLSNRSIAYGIAQAMQREGAELAFTYVVDKLKDRVVEMAAEFGSNIVLRCDVSSDQEIGDMFAQLIAPGLGQRGKAIRADIVGHAECLARD